ncbi:ATP-dependent RNA helicase HrpA [Desulfobulbus alkaliphilus]|uniref:ATP-dependent RNA helicase HrpA n=1 Tax=Desulfobulbus alkaliphilus TaxID=869814 RepID=UPI0019659F48|nr:ATP-dependent RNA helicase HrpA [Desulfobulbus alkaliphilus]MBM9537148.1 ATP-dependent RNA helicase HrpA [Desulfobulbus alkaliphilus]
MYLSYPLTLPVNDRRDDIVAAIREHQVLIIIGDTGSGKTTQLPKMCLEAGRGSSGLIGCTQPRRIAALSVAERVGEELRAPNLVGYKIRFHDRTSEQTLIKFMTDGILLAETRRDRTLSGYDTIIVDEAHERSLNIDFLLGYLKNLLPSRPDLKLIVSSATIDAEKFSRYFDQAPVIQVSGRTYPITTQYREAKEGDEDDGTTYVDQAIAAVAELAMLPAGGDILVFMPTERDINDTIEGLRQAYEQSHLLLPLFGRLPAAEQRKIFRPAHKRKIIVATNVAETSITVPGIRYVVDTGLARISRYNPRSGTTSLRVSRVARASCEQRRGRCGRTGPGTCIRLYSEEDFLSRESFTPPEIQRANLAEVILQMIDLNLGDPGRFPFIDPPSSNAIRDGYRTLKELGALNDDHRLTARGRLMARLPLDPRLSRMIIEGTLTDAVREVTILAAALSIQDPRIRPPGKENKADETHRWFVDQRSDFSTLLNIWNSLHAEGENLSKSRLSRFCKAHFLSWQRTRDWIDVHDQISRLLKTNKIVPGQEQQTDYAAIHTALASGFLRNICTKKEKNLYLSAGNKEVVLFPGSGLYGKGPQWAVAAEFVATTQLFARTVATVDVTWLERLGGDLCKRSWSNPHWEKKSGKVLALERVSLFGLSIVAGRKVDYGRINENTLQEAREIFIRSALIGNQLGGQYPFLMHNAALIATYEEMEERFRRRNILVDDETLYAFYDARLGKVYDRFTLNRLLRRRKNDQFLHMGEQDICLAVPESEESYRFPHAVRCGDIELALSYLFAPGDEADGVSVHIPRHLLPHINPLVFEWLVPGLLPEKLLLLCKRLPKQLRRRLVPLPDAVDRILDGLSLYKGSLYQELERVLLRAYQVQVQRTDWQADALPPHLRMRFLLVDEEGTVLCTSRSFTDLLNHEQSLATETHATDCATLPAPRTISAEDLDAIEKKILCTDADGRVTGLFFPALEIDPLRNRLELRYIDNEAESRRLNRLGLHHLYTQACSGEVAAIRSLCKTVLSRHSSSWLSLGAGVPAAKLRADLQAFLMDALFGAADGALPSQAQFLENIARARAQGIPRTATALLDTINETLRQRRMVARTIADWATKKKKNKSYQKSRHDEYLAALEQILPASFLQTLPAESLPHKSRHLQALARRIERADHSPLKDNAKAKRLQIPLDRLRHFLQFDHPSPPCQVLLEEYRQLVEEFRVSLFAPELGTSQPVSEQRLEQKWRQVMETCQKVE